MNWKKFTVDELRYIAEWAIEIGMFYLAKEIIKDIENHRSGSSK